MAITERINLLIRISVISILVFGFGFYGYYQSKNLITGPKIAIESPENGQTFSNSYIEIVGKTKNVASIILNGKQIFVDKDGSLKEGLLLAFGYNIIEIEAKDRFGRTVKETREIVLK